MTLCNPCERPAQRVIAKAFEEGVLAPSNKVGKLVVV